MTFQKPKYNGWNSSKIICHLLNNFFGQPSLHIHSCKYANTTEANIILTKTKQSVPTIAGKFPSVIPFFWHEL
jgi:hypothetical protein